MHQNTTASLRAVATIALPCPRRSRVRASNACHGPGCRTALPATSIKAQRADADPRLEIRPERAGPSPDRRTFGSRPR